MIPDAECLVIMRDILKSLDVGDFSIKVNHRQLLDGIFAVCGVPDKMFSTICSAVDKLDKLAWKDVRSEMTMKGLPEEAADAIQTYVCRRGRFDELITTLQQDAKLSAHPSAKAALEDLSRLSQFLTSFRAQDACVLDLSLARGLSYYTGVIFEAVLQDSTVHVGSVGGGGRYDKLVGRFKKKGDVPCVGFSIGVERLFTVMQEKRKGQAVRCDTKVLVCSVDSGSITERMQLVSELWQAGVPAEIVLKESVKIQAQLKYAETNGIPFAAIFGPDELKDGTVKLKDLATGDQKLVKREELIQLMKQ